MRKEELVELFEKLHKEDTTGNIEAVVHDVNGLQIGRAHV